ncbi:PAS domain S-box-containing protein [Arenibacter palladensis]|uniref:histidine kinase n=1 Tax=Arenibacter palladensis TaxID=237373 RepID=A0A1M5DEN7_9FLAO|nr:PAS domain S-box protein [Arenibacter palladensis]MDO6605064.1 PAS domain S-box protein [Arenibacter palladensis]SHF65437.1 PAS domain S-box-containing protein [Arenibacter palladensis]
MIMNTPIVSNQFLIKQLPKATAFINKEFKVVLASDKWAEDFGFQGKDYIGKSIYELFGSTSKKWSNNLLACFDGKFPESEIEVYPDNSSKERWFEWTNIPWYDEQENIIGAIVQTEDVTDRVKNELRVEKLEFLQKETGEHGKIGNWEYQKSKDKFTCCEMIRRIFEVDDDFEINIDNSVNFYKTGYSRNTISMAIYSANQKKTPWNEKLQIVTAKGNEKWVNVSGKPLYKNGEYVGLIGIVQDITDFVQKEQKTKDNEHLLKTLINNLPLQIYIKDTQSKKLLANKSELQFLGIENECDIIGKDDFDLYDRATAQKFREEDIEVMISQIPMLNKELTRTNPDGSVITFLTSKIPLIGENGEVTGLVGISMDISEQKQKQKELKSLISVTSSQNKKLINFAHIVSHNLRSHSANFAMLLDFLGNEEDENERTKIMEMLMDSSKHLMETLHNLNDIVAINTESNIIKKEVNFNKKLNAVLKQVNNQLNKAKATVISEVSDDVYINVVPDYLKNILTNIITNALKYKKPDVDPIIKLSVNYVQNYTVISIEDNGLGLDLKKYGTKLFGMYKTFHGNSDAKGLGLYITKNQIEAMHGKISATSQVGVGSTFNLYFNDKN